jgi:hypothetical protein
MEREDPIPMTTPVAPHPREAIPKGEAEDIEALTRISLDLLDTSRRPVRRGQHPKHHGCVEAEFKVEDVPPDLQVGLFRQPDTYRAWIRFSNASQDDDGRGDIHGMAIKVMGVTGEKAMESERDELEQDFVLMDHPAFFCRDARSARALGEAMKRSLGRPRLKSWLFWAPTERERRAAYVVLSHFILGFRFHELNVLRAAMSKKPRSPLETTYWSATPYALGDRAVKYSVRPLKRPDNVPEPTDMLSADRLRAAMAVHLDRADAGFEFLVQVREPSRKKAMPVEDASIEWSEEKARFRKVATIVIPKQTFDTPERMGICEHRLSYNPWRSLDDHCPLGGINRARKKVYEAASKRRHELNEESRAAPVA